MTAERAPDPVLRRSRRDRVLVGVCGGLARYLDLDPVLVRLVAVALLLSGVGVVAYLVAWLAIPEEDEDQEPVPSDTLLRRRANRLLGLALVVAGVLLLLRGQLWFHSYAGWPLVVVAAGCALALVGRRPSRSDDPACSDRQVGRAAPASPPAPGAGQDRSAGD